MHAWSAVQARHGPDPLGGRFTTFYDGVLCCGRLLALNGQPVRQCAHLHRALGQRLCKSLQASQASLPTSMISCLAKVFQPWVDNRTSNAGCQAAKADLPHLLDIAEGVLDKEGVSQTLCSGESSRDLAAVAVYRLHRSQLIATIRVVGSRNGR